MKTKIVLWGENASNEKVLIALELMEKDNKVNIYVFPAEVSTEEFYQNMLDQWREGKPLEFPQPHQLIERPLSISDSLLPDDIKVERTDLISRAQAEWQVVVLSSKLYEMYRDEIDEIKSKIDGLSEYDNKLWDEAKSFWLKVQDKVQDQTLFRDHANILKERTNNLFDKLKQLRNSLQAELEQSSKVVSDALMAEINEVDEKINKGLGLKPLFEQMKSIQAKYKDAKLSHQDRKPIWDKIDATFKALKEKNPSTAKSNHPGGALQSRYEGLIDTIKMMEKSIERDRQDYDFQVKKIEQTDGQLEMQIRQAKLKMLEERISSKDAKLQDMNKTKIELESRLSKEEIKKAVEAKKNEAKEVVKQKIATDMEKSQEERETMADLLENAASKIKDGKKKGDSLLGAITETLSETFADAIDSVKAVAEVVEDKIDDVMDVLEDKAEIAMEKAEEVFDKAEEKVDSTIASLKTDDKTEEEVKFEDKKEEDKPEA
jgi:chromosome segregation ATPase